MTLRIVATLLLCGLVSAAHAAPDKGPTAVDLLFNTKHLDSVKKGDVVNYKFKREVQDMRNGGDPFEDDIVIKITGETPENAKNVKLNIFTGDRARAGIETPGMTGNPMLIWQLNRCVASYSKVAGGSPMYLKGKIREALGKDAKVETAQFEIDGKTVDGHKVTIVPFANDPAKNRMNGYENSIMEFLVSNQVPGYLYAMKANYFSNGKGTPKIQESVTFTSLGEAQ